MNKSVLTGTILGSRLAIYPLVCDNHLKGCFCLELLVSVYSFLRVQCFFLLFIILELTSPVFSFANSDSKDMVTVGDTLIQPIAGEPTNLLPFMTTDLASQTVASDFYIAPLKYDKNLEIALWAAESYKVLDGGLRLHFVLKKGIYWSDGVEFTADDVEFTYQLMIDPKTPTAYSDDYKKIQSFTKIDTYTFEVTYAEPYPRALTTWMLTIMPKHALEGADLRTTPLARRPISCGPYILERWQAGSQLRLKSNPRYFLGRPHLDGIVYRVIPDPTTTFMELMSGNIDIMPNLSPFQAVYQTDKPEFAKQFDVYQWVSSAYTFLGYNLKSPLFSDVRVRQALAYAIDKEDIIKGALFGQGVPIVGPYKPGSWVYNTNIKDRAYSIETSLDLLSKAGWNLDSKGVLRNEKGVPFQFTILVDQGNETRIKIAMILQEQCKKIGVSIKLRTVEWAAFINQFVMKGFFDAVILGWSVPLDPDNFPVWHSSRSNSLNFIGYANNEVDQLLEKARSTFDQTERKKLYDRFQEILHEEQPYTFLFVPYTMSAVNKRFKGLEEAPAGVFHNIDKWWVPLPEQRYRLTK